MMRKMRRVFLSAFLLLMLAGFAIVGNAQETDAMAEAEYDGYKVSVLDYEYDEAWKSYTDDPGTPAVCVRFYFENENGDPLYLLESFGIAAYQDGTELDYISLNSEDEEAQNTITAVMDGAGLYCMMAFETVSDSDVVLRITEPTAEANSLIELTMGRPEAEIMLETDGVKYTVYATDNQVIVKFENTNNNVAFISKTNVSFYDEAGELIDVETMDAVFVDIGSINYGEVTYHGDYASVEVVPYVYDDEETQFDYNDGFETTEIADESVSELDVIITNTGGKEASAMLTVIYYKDNEIFYVAEDIGETWLYAGDSEEVTIELPHDEEWEFLEYDSYEIIVMGYAYE